MKADNTYIQTFSRPKTAGKEEIFTEVSSFFYELFWISFIINYHTP